MDVDRSTKREKTFAVKKGPPSQTVVRAVAEVSGADPLETPPLYEAVDPEALDHLFRGRPGGTVTFDYDGYTVTVRSDAEVIVQE